VSDVWIEKRSRQNSNLGVMWTSGGKMSTEQQKVWEEQQEEKKCCVRAMENERDQKSGNKPNPLKK
jgi:hypothetical protein